MKSNYLDTQSDDKSRLISAQARLLMSRSRHKLQNRQQTMLHRAASELGIDT
ncbi:hypothetical protein ACF3DV_20120 [Chlorogloeopsis fritschii PCC 9212]|jgi:hypothetical protein|uniref:Uncharacterized protein n=1 Tax=Chlorogloeopsis fritschii PCC 6912 TaxID=211165 RepID=A0A3S0ZVN0_CHLFR|nr:hypothetical protein [Chlorogloeopsis fritschii]MBF2005391.1 hypothetical protein [Chlorogloeopsis fritschii C42_A2020_084]RUR84608.1 hypothetical protein PCC6912_15030 [Chlorogloeopsis fritschii PCC 6912]